MNHTYRLVWNRALSMFVAVSESTRSMGKSGGVKAIGGALAAVVAMAALPMAAHAQSTFLDFSSLAGWTTQGGTQLISTTDAYSLGGQNFSLTPAAGNNMVKITAGGSSINGAAAADTALGLSAGTIAGLLGNNTTNFGLLSKIFTLNPGTYSFAWAYAAGDYQPYNDGVLFSVVGEGTQNVMSLARNGSNANDTSGPQASTLVLGSYGSTAWITTSFTVAAAGNYTVSYADYNWNDTGLDPVYYVSGVAGTFTGTAIVPISGGTPAPVAISAGGTSASSGLAAGTVAPAFDGGTLHIDTPNSTYTQAFTINGNGGTIDQGGTGSTFSGVFSDDNGSGTLHIVNSGNGGAVTLTAANTYTGATDVASGATLALSGAGAISTSSGVALNGGTLDIAATDNGAVVTNLTGDNGTVALGDKTLTVSAAGGSFGGTIAGSGGLTIAGGNQTITASQAYTGATAIDSGAALTIAGNGTGIASSANVINNGTIDVSGATVPTAFNNLSGTGTLALGATTTVLNGAGANFAGTINGAGGVIVDAAMQTFSGNNGYTGQTQIGAGATLALAGSGSIAGSSGVTLDGGQLDIAATTAGSSIAGLSGDNGLVTLGDKNLTLSAASGVFGGNIAGTGGVTVAGGIQTINAGLSYSGATQVDTGAQLVILGNGGVAQSGNVVNNGVIDVSGATGSTSFNNLSGNGALALGATTTVLKGTGADFAGTIDGSGGIVVAAAKQTLSGANSFTGLTEIGAGSALALAGAGTIAASSGVVVNGALDIGAATGGAKLSTLSGAGTVALGTSQLTLTAASGSFGGVIAGSGGVTVAGGTATLSGVNTYTGATQVASGGTLVLTNSLGVAASSGVTANGTFDISGANGGASIASLDGSGAVVLGTKQLVLSNASGSFGGNISGTGGVLVNAGTQTLTGVSTYTGMTEIDSGATLAIAGGGAITSSGGVLNNGTLTIASTLPSVMTSLAGSGTLNLLNQSVTFTQGADNFTGNITGTGTMSVTGGVQQLSGTNTIAGPVSATSGGTLRVASDVSLGASGNNIILDNGILNTTGTMTMARAVSITGTGTTAVNSGTTLTSNGATSGSGTLVKTGAGTLVLGGDNSALTGGAVINGGTVKLASATGVGSGTLALNAGTLESAVNLTLAQNVALAGGTTLRTDAATTTVLSGTVTTAAGGNGCFSKSGSGTLNLTGNATFGSGVCVEEGTMRINGLTGSTFVAVAQGATLRGAGTVSAPITVSGTLAPGNSPGTLNSSATVTMLAGSNYQEDINGTGTASGPGNYSRLLVSGAGQFVAGGATLTPNLVHITGTDTYTPYVPKVGDSFRIVTAAGGLVGRFGTIVQPEGLAANTRLAAFYNGDATHSIDLRVLPSSYAAYSLVNGGNGNTQVSGVALDKIMTADQVGTATAAQAQLAYAVSNFAGTSVVGLAHNLAGEVHGAMAAVAPLAGQAVQGTVLHQLDGATTGVNSALWADLAGNRAEWSADSLASGFVANRGQLTIGVDAFRNDAGRIGVGYSHARANLAADSGSGTLRENMAFVYGNVQGMGLGIDAMAGAGRTNWETERANPLGAGALTTGLDGRNTLASIGISAPMEVNGATFKPFVRVLWQRTERDAGTEGAAMAALALGEFSASGTRTTAGLSGNVKGGSAGKTPYTMQYSVGAGRDNGNLVRAVVDSSIAGVGTRILAPHAGRSFVQAAVSGTVMHTANASSYYGVSTELHSDRTDVSLSGGLRYAF